MHLKRRKLEATLLIGLLILIATTEVIAVLLIILGMSSNPILVISSLVAVNCGLLKYALRIIFSNA